MAHTPLTIAIIGAGIGGLTAAVALREAPGPSHDSAPSARSRSAMRSANESNKEPA